MTEYLGKLLLLAGCSALGIGHGLQLSKRTACLQAFRRSLEGITRELTFSLRPLSDLLDGAARESEGPVRDFFAACRTAFIAGGGESWADSWRTALRKTPLPLKEEDRRVLGEAGDVLGRYDGESQRQGLWSILSRLEVLIGDARTEARRLTKVYATVGITAGLFCCILL